MESEATATKGTATKTVYCYEMRRVARGTACMFCDATSASVSDRVFIEATNGTAICSECVVVCVSVLHESASQRGEATSPQTGTK